MSKKQSTKKQAPTMKCNPSHSEFVVATGTTRALQFENDDNIVIRAIET